MTVSFDELIEPKLTASDCDLCLDDLYFLACFHYFFSDTYQAKAKDYRVPQYFHSQSSGNRNKTFTPEKPEHPDNKCHAKL